MKSIKRGCSRTKEKANQAATTKLLSLLNPPHKPVDKNAGHGPGRCIYKLLRSREEWGSRNRKAPAGGNLKNLF